MSLDIVGVIISTNFQLDLDFNNGEHQRFDMHSLLTVRPT